MKTGDNFKENGEIFKKFLEHYEKKASGKTSENVSMKRKSNENCSIPLLSSGNNSKFVMNTLEDNYPPINHINKANPENKIKSIRPKSEYKPNMKSSKI